MIDPVESKTITSETEGLFHEMEKLIHENDSIKAKHTLKICLCEAFCAGMRRYAWWKDGREIVGTCGVVYKEAEARILKENGLKLLKEQ